MRKRLKSHSSPHPHFSYSNGLVEPYLDYAYRMHSAFADKPKAEALTFALKSAERAGCSLAVRGGENPDG